MMSSLALADTVSFKTPGVEPDLKLDLDHESKRISIISYDKSYHSVFSLLSINSEISPKSCDGFAESIEESENPFKVLYLNEPVTLVGPMLNIIPRDKSLKERIYSRLGMSKENRYLFDDHYAISNINLRFTWGEESLSSITGLEAAEQDLKASFKNSNYMENIWKITRKDLACDLKSGQLQLSLEVFGSLNIVDMQYSHPITHVENTLKNLQSLLSPNLEKSLNEVGKEQRLIYLAGLSGLALDQTQIKIHELEPKKFMKIFSLLVNKNAKVQNELDPFAFKFSFTEPVHRSIPTNFSVEMKFQDIKGY